VQCTWQFFLDHLHEYSQDSYRYPYKHCCRHKSQSPPTSFHLKGTKGIKRIDEVISFLDIFVLMNRWPEELYLRKLECRMSCTRGHRGIPYLLRYTDRSLLTSYQKPRTLSFENLDFYSSLRKDHHHWNQSREKLQHQCNLAIARKSCRE
jgi:hypothetical protein